MPEFHAREPEHQEWKAAVLAGEIELDEIDTDAVPRWSPTRRRRRRCGHQRADHRAGPSGPCAEELELFELFARIVAAKEGYPQAPAADRDVFEETWLHHATVVVVAHCEGLVAGAYYLKPNQPGRAAHIANAGYVVDRPVPGPRASGGRLVEDSINRAPTVGFDAIQFNLVFESNPARQLYE